MSSIEITPELMAGFLDEVPEYLDMLDVGLMELEARAGTGSLALVSPEDREQMNTMFRAAHSLKGLSAAFGFDRIKELTHRMETLFDQVRMCKRQLTPESIETLFKVFDRLKILVRELTEEGGTPVEIGDVLLILDRILDQPLALASPKLANSTTIAAPDAAPIAMAESLDGLVDRRTELTDAAAQNASLSPSREISEGATSIGPVLEPELAAIFLETSWEALEEFSQGLLTLEKSPDDKVLINSIFRCAHNLKGASGAVGLSSINRLTHQVETVLDLLRTNRLSLCEALKTALFRASDQLRGALEEVRGGRFDQAIVSDMGDDFAFWTGTPSAPPESDASLPSVEAGGPDQSVSGEGLENRWSVNVQFPKDFAEAGIQAYLIYNKLNELADVVSTTPDMDSLTGDTLMESVVYVVSGCDDPARLEHAARMYQVQNVTVVSNRSGRRAKIDARSPSNSVEGLALTPPAALPGTPTIRCGSLGVASEQADGSGIPLASGSAGGAIRSPSIDLRTVQTDAASDGTVTPPLLVNTGSKPSSVGGAAGQTNKEAATKPNETLRVDQERLDQLMNLGGELVINKARFMQIHGKFRELFDGRNTGYAVTDFSDRLAQFSERLELLRTRDVTRRDVDELGHQLLHLRQGFQVVHNVVQRVHKLRPAMYDFDEALHGLTRVTEGIQKGIMGTRMVPVGPTFARFKRMVRDIAKTSGKRIQLILRGESTELDKRMIDELGDPLTHMVRNAVDHGLESPEARIAAGKNPEGTVVLEASHRGSTIWIEVSDDGGGINIERVKQKAVERGLATQAQVDAMSDREIMQFIMQPGFSTAAVVTDLSGRGMGMDIVKSKIDKLSGIVEVDSTFGRGTRIVIKLPLTLAILTSMVAGIGEGVYAMPLETVVEIITVKREDVQFIQRKRVVRVRDRIVPVVVFEDIFSTDIPELATQSRNNDELTLVIIGFERDQMGLVVDRLYGQEDVVIKSIAENYRNVRGVAGASIRGDGSVSLILDVGIMMELASKCAGLTEAESSQLAATEG